MRRFYTAILYALLPLLPLRLLWRARKQPEYLAHWRERFGRYPQQAAAPVIWLHAVSLGETRASAPLVRALMQRYPRHQILLTHMTPTGRAASAELFGAQVLSCYLPYDYPFAVRRFLDQFRPVLGLLMETEIWPNLIHQCRRRAIPLALVNARMSQKSARHYARYPKLTRRTLGLLDTVLAQTEADARRLRELGAGSARVAGNLKFDASVPEVMRALGAVLRARFGGRPVLLAASTRAGEEAMVLDARERMRIPDLLTVIVPRHPERFAEVAALARARGLRLQLRSAEENVAPATQVVLGDSMGELMAYYAACDIALIGGSLLPFGGQNLIEACAVGVPVLIGPHTYNFEEAARLAIEAGAALRVSDADDIARQVLRLCADAPLRAQMSEEGRNFVAAHQGAGERILAEIGRLLPSGEVEQRP